MKDDGYMQENYSKAKLNPAFRRYRAFFILSFDISQICLQYFDIPYFPWMRFFFREIRFLVSCLVGAVMGFVGILAFSSEPPEDWKKYFKFGEEGWTRYGKAGFVGGGFIGALLGGILGFFLPFPGGMAAGIFLGTLIGQIGGFIISCLFVPFVNYLTMKFSTTNQAYFCDSMENQRTYFFRAGAKLGSLFGTIIGSVIGTFIFPFLGSAAGAALGAAAGGLLGGIVYAALGNKISQWLASKTNNEKDTASIKHDYAIIAGAWFGGQWGLGAILLGLFPKIGVMLAAASSIVFSIIGFVSECFFGRKNSKQQTNTNPTAYPRWAKYAAIGLFYSSIIGGIIGFLVFGPIGGLIGAGIAGLLGGISGLAISAYKSRQLTYDRVEENKGANNTQSHACFYAPSPAPIYFPPKIQQTKTLNSQPPTTNNQQPTTNNQQPTTNKHIPSLTITP